MPAVVLQNDSDPVGARDNMVVRDDVAGGVDDEARAERGDLPVHLRQATILEKPAQELIELAHTHKLELKALSVQSTTLDDVFLHYTGHGLTEMPETAAPTGRGRGGH